MADRLPAFFLPRVAVIALLVLGATAGLTLAAGSSLPATPTPPAVTVPAPPPLVVPDVRGQAYVFAKGTLEESGFAWRVAGSVQGYAANMVTAQSPPAGTKLIDTGTPAITLTLKRNSGYPQVGEPEVASSYPGTVVQPVATEGLGPALPATTTPAKKKTPAKTTPAKTMPAATTPATTTPATTTPAATTPATTTPAATTPVTTTPDATAAPATPKAATPVKNTAPTWPQNRPIAFSVPGATKEPLDEMPLPTRAKALMKWLDAHPTKTSANVNHWMYQHAWIVTGAKMGWWRGAEALQTLAAVDRRAQQRWGIGAKSATVAEQALSDVQVRSKS